MQAMQENWICLSLAGSQIQVKVACKMGIAEEQSRALSLGPFRKWGNEGQLVTHGQQ